MNYYDSLKPKPYALYIHGLGSGASSGTNTSFGHYFPGYEWLSPEMPIDPFEALAVLQDWITAFHPQLIAGTSMGGMLTIFADAPEAIKLMVNPVIEMETALRKLGYGKHPFHAERENGDKEFVIDEVLVRRFIQFRQEHSFVHGKRNIAVFSTRDDVVGDTNMRKNMRYLTEDSAFEVITSDKFAHRANENAIKLLMKQL